MFEMATADMEKIVHMSDTLFETANVLRVFMDLSHELKVSNNVWSELDKVALFLKKYDCLGPVTILGNEIVNLVDHTNYHKVFEAAGHLDHHKLAISLCTKLIHYNTHQTAAYSLGIMVQRIGIEKLLQLPPKFYHSVIAALVDTALDPKPCKGWEHLLKQLESKEVPFVNRRPRRARTSSLFTPRVPTQTSQASGKPPRPSDNSGGCQIVIVIEEEEGVTESSSNGKKRASGQL